VFHVPWFYYSCSRHEQMVSPDANPPRRLKYHDRIRIWLRTLSSLHFSRGLSRPPTSYSFVRVIQNKMLLVLMYYTAKWWIECMSSMCNSFFTYTKQTNGIHQLEMKSEIPRLDYICTLSPFFLRNDSTFFLFWVIFIYWSLWDVSSIFLTIKNTRLELF